MFASLWNTNERTALKILFFRVGFLPCMLVYLLTCDMRVPLKDQDTIVRVKIDGTRHLRGQSEGWGGQDHHCC